ncbi:AEX-3 domain-containing protein [Pisolithus croceorrhizus]|nr:AEX-3 domain-containing protein [Pisolithus croceorrhizus]
MVTALARALSSFQGDTVFWLPYALALVSRHPIYDLMRDYLTLSWARFSKDVQSHTLQISKILAHPAPRAGELIKLDASLLPSFLPLSHVSRAGFDFGRGLVDINFTMWPLFKALNIDNILTCCEIALAPTGRILFYSRHPAMLGTAVSTVKYLVELRGWNGIALPAVHARDAKIYIDDPGPWILGLATEARYSVRPSPEGHKLFELPITSSRVLFLPSSREISIGSGCYLPLNPTIIPDHCVPSEFKEAFPAGRFRPVCKVQAKRGGEMAAVADTIKPPEWWHSTRIIQAFDAVLEDKFRKPSLFKRLTFFGAMRRPPRLTAAEQHIPTSPSASGLLPLSMPGMILRLRSVDSPYAERLSVEAEQLRSKIGKEQKETKRLSGLVSLTAAEKVTLQQRLGETERAHKEALIELHRMREMMERMEQERAEMVAEGNECYQRGEEVSVSPTRKKRFSATQEETVQDGMTAVDEGISERSDRIAQKVLQIQQKLENALASERIQDWKNKSLGRQASGSGLLAQMIVQTRVLMLQSLVRPYPARGTKLINQPPARGKRRERSDTTSTSQTGSAATVTRGSLDIASTPRRSPSLNRENPPGHPEPEATGSVATEDTMTPTTETPPVRKVASGASLSALSPEAPTTTPPTPALTPGLSSTTD